MIKKVLFVCVAMVGLASSAEFASAAELIGVGSLEPGTSDCLVFDKEYSCDTQSDDYGYYSRCDLPVLVKGPNGGRRSFRVASEGYGNGWLSGGTAEKSSKRRMDLEIKRLSFYLCAQDSK